MSVAAWSVSRAMAQHCTAIKPARRHHTSFGGTKRKKNITLCSANVHVKISVAQSSLKLDLSNCDLEAVPLEVFDIDDLEELSLAGNNLRELPAEVGSLTNLQRLQLAGNCISSLPSDICRLQKLQGLWLHGNILQSLPDQLGALTSLEQLSLSGNRIPVLPPSVSGLSKLRELGLAGNQLQYLPSEISALSSLTILSLHGNRLQALPSGLSALLSLRELWLQGNCLTQLGDAVQGLKSLKELSVADNMLQDLPLGGGRGPLVALEKLWAYGNSIRSLPSDVHLRLPSIKSIWLEANPLTEEAVANIMEAAEKLPSLSALGLDTTQVSRAESAQLKALGQKLKVGHIIGQGPGYFKLQPGPGNSTTPPACNQNHSCKSASPAASEARSAHESSPTQTVVCHSLDQLQALHQQRKHGKTPLMLIVAFGSAPGTPNWGGALGKVLKEVDADVAQNIDIMYVVDPYRDWYAGGEPKADSSSFRKSQPQETHGDDAGGHESVAAAHQNGSSTTRRRRQRRQEAAVQLADACASVRHEAGNMEMEGVRPLDVIQRLGKVTGMYERVLMLGDSMGATAALLFSPLATNVHAFCPQLDLMTSSIRPGRSPRWWAQLKETALLRVSQCTGKVVVHTGYWQHDLDQANMLPRESADVKVYPVDSHRLALYLDSRKKLVPLLRDAILQELGMKTGNVRLANLV